MNKQQLSRLALLACLGSFTTSVWADVSGTVFRDFSLNHTTLNTYGVLDSNELGVAGINIIITGDNGVTETVQSDATGKWISTVGALGSKVRVEFTNIPSYLHESTTATQQNSSVRFVNDGTTNVNLALFNPDEYSQSSNPYLAVPQYINGDPLASNTIGDRTGLYIFPYNATSADDLTQTPTPLTKATAAQIGATWGITLQRSTKTLFTAAVVRRFAGFGPLGIGGLYKVDVSDLSNISTGSLNYVDVKTIGIPVGDNPRDGTACNSLAISSDQPAHDIAAGQQIGSVGIGGISMDNDHNRLWLVNMADRKLYGIQNVNPNITPTASDVLGGYNIELPTGMSCENGILRPWAVKYYQNKVYVGASCDASNTYPGTEELAGYILRFDPNSTSAGFTVEHAFRFNTPRASYGPDLIAFWYGWQNNLISSPLLTSIEFDLDGSLMVGVLDRGTMMSGTNTYNSLDCADTNLSDITGAGDVLRFCKSGNSYINGGTAGCTTVIPDAVKAHDEYYWGDYGPLPNEKIAFNETTQGGLTFLPGSGQLVSNAFDPKGWHQGGIYWFNNQTGGDDNRYIIYTTQTGLSYPPETMGKLAGLGDLEAILDPAPIEVGNRVWNDANKNGLQDPDELGIESVMVTLTCGTDSVTTTTDNQGNYYFNSSTNASMLTLGKACSINIDPTQIALKDLTLSPSDANGINTNEAKTDTLDSDATLINNLATINFTVGNAGENNHSFDIGFHTLDKIDLKLTKAVSSSSVQPGEIFTYTLTLTNESTTTATNVNVKELLPSRLQYISDDSGGTYNPSTGNWQVGTVLAGSDNAKILTLTVTAPMSTVEPPPPTP